MDETNNARILTMSECARQSRISRDTLRREIKAGRGPTVIKLSPRRYGIDSADWEQWLQSRRQVVGGAE